MLAITDNNVLLDNVLGTNNKIDAWITNIETEVGGTTTNAIMGGATTKGVIGLIVGLMYVLDHWGWPLLDHLDWGTIYLIYVNYTKATIYDKIDVIVDGIGYL